MSAKLRYLPVFIFVIVLMTMVGLLGAQSGLSPQSGPQAARSLSPEERIARLEERLDLALALKDERIESINARSEDVYKLIQLVGTFAAATLLFFSLRDVVLRWKEGQRQRGIDEIVKDMMNLQRLTSEQQVRLGALHLAQVEASPNQQFAAVQNVNDVIEVVRRTLAFRLEQEAKVAEALGEIELIKAERDRTKGQKLTHALVILEHFTKMSRMEFAALTDEQYKRGIRLEGLANDLNEFLAEQGFEIKGDLLYTCGVIAYYDNDIIEAKDYLDRAAQCRSPEHNGQLATDQKYRRRFAFTHYFRALIHKNWGDLSEAQHEIEQSAKLLEDQTTEFLTPVTKAEVLSYIEGVEERCRTELEGLIQRIDDLEAVSKHEGKSLDPNQLRLRNRALVLCGNTFFVRGDFEGALTQYTKAIGFNPNDYYALASTAQCKLVIGDMAAAVECFQQCVEAIERSGDLRRKRERITRAVIAVIAANSAKACNDTTRWEQYAREARDLLSGNLAVDGMVPKFFSPSTKRLVSAAELLKELESVHSSTE